MVNADSTQLLTILKNLQNSISSIETTKNSVKLKYQQLGNEWNDKKYYELGNIVKDCNKALNDLLQIIYHVGKFMEVCCTSSSWICHVSDGIIIYAS